MRVWPRDCPCEPQSRPAVSATALCKGKTRWSAGRAGRTIRLAECAEAENPMSTAFSRTIRSLEADGFRRQALSLMVAAGLIGAWASWSVLSRVSLYELSNSARVEVEQAATPLESPLGGHVLTTHLTVGREINAGEVLVELDSASEQLELGEQ